MKEKAENLRDLLFHLKSDYLKEYRHDEYQQMDQRCRENLYGMVSKETDYFAHNLRCNLNTAIYVISKYVLERNKPSVIAELQDRFNGIATGIFAFEFDNQTELVVSDIFGNPYRMHIFSIGKNTYDFSFYNMNGQGLLLSFSEPKDAERFSQEHLKEIDNLMNYQKQYYEKLENDRKRRNEINQYKDYISVKRISSGYAHYYAETTIKKTIPITLTKDEIVRYTDGWSHNFGNSISVIREDENEIVYKVRINTD